MYLYGKSRSRNRALSVHCSTEFRNHPYDRIKEGYGHALAPLVIQKDHGQLLIKSALHSYAHNVHCTVMNFDKCINQLFAQELWPPRR